MRSAGRGTLDGTKANWSETAPAAREAATVETLFHASEEPDIARFEPRVTPGSPAGPTDRLVWAIDDEHLANYLLPRDCPRVCFYPLPTSDPADVARLMGQTTAKRVVAVESGWLDALRAARLHVYELPTATFEPFDTGAGYYVSRLPVDPLRVATVDDLLAALLAREVELRITPSLWPLRDAVVSSTLQFSCIRMRNARPR